MSKQLQRGSLGALGKPTNNNHGSNNHNSAASNSKSAAGIERGYGKDSQQRRRKKPAPLHGSTHLPRFRLTMAAPSITLALIIIAIGFLKLGSCALDHTLDALKMQEAQPKYNNPYFQNYGH